MCSRRDHITLSRAQPETVLPDLEGVWVVRMRLWWVAREFVLRLFFINTSQLSTKLPLDR